MKQGMFAACSERATKDEIMTVEVASTVSTSRL